MSHRKLRNFITFSLGSIISLIIGFISTPIITRLFTPHDFGIYSSFEIVISISYILVGFGLINGLNRFYFQQTDRLNLVYTCLKMSFVILVILGIAFCFFQEQISIFIIGSYNSYLICIIITTLMIRLVNDYALNIVILEEKRAVFSIITLLDKVLFLLLVILLYNTIKDKYFVLIISYIVTMLTATVTIIYATYRDLRENSIQNTNKINIKELMQYSTPFVLTSSINLLYSYIDKISLRHYHGLDEVGIYSAAFRITVLFNIIHQLIIKFYKPELLKLFEVNKDEYKRSITKIVNLLTFILLSTGGLTILGKEVFVILLGSKYHESVSIMPLLMFMPIMFGLAQLISFNINLSNNTRKHVSISIITVLINLIGNIYLVPKWGIFGAAFTTMMTWIIYFGIIYYFSVKYIPLQIDFKRIAISTIFIGIISVLQYSVDMVLTTILTSSYIIITCLLFKGELLSLYNVLKEYLNKVMKKRNHF